MAKATRKSNTRTIRDLYADFEKAHAAYQVIPRDTPEMETRMEDRFNRAVDKCGRIARRIVNSPATDIDEMLLKIGVVGWAIGAQCKSVEQLDRWSPPPIETGEEIDVLVSLREDLHRLKASLLHLVHGELDRLIAQIKGDQGQASIS